MELDINSLKLEVATKCWSMSDLSKNAQIGTATLYNILHKKTRANSKTLGKIAKALNVPIRQLLKK